MTMRTVISWSTCSPVRDEVCHLLKPQKHRVELSLCRKRRHGFIGLTTGLRFEKTFFAKERHQHKPSHVERRARRAIVPTSHINQPRGYTSSTRLPENFILRPKTAEGMIPQIANHPAINVQNV
jgi:hypothetical protein